MDFRVNVSLSTELVVSAPTEQDAQIKAGEMVKNMNLKTLDLDMNMKEIDEIEKSMGDYKEKLKDARNHLSEQMTCSFCESEEDVKYCEKRSPDVYGAYVGKECCHECDIRDGCEDPVWK